MNGEGDAEVRQNREIASEDNGRRGGPSSPGTAAPLDALSDSQVSTSTALARIKFTAKMLGSLIQLEVNKGFSEKGTLCSVLKFHSNVCLHLVGELSNSLSMLLLMQYSSTVVLKSGITGSSKDQEQDFIAGIYYRTQCFLSSSKYQFMALKKQRANRSI